MLPSSFSIKLGEKYSEKVNLLHKKERGQYFTPIEIAKFMAESINALDEELNVLDPGFGTGILTCALLENLALRGKVKRIEICAYETDLKLIKYAEKVLKYLRDWLAEKSIELRYILHVSDFILDNANQFSDQNTLIENMNTTQYDVVISNPPYFKMPIDDIRAKLAKEIISGQPNIYAIFLYLSIRLLKRNGEFVFIVPRSFASGQYFKLFRNKFFNQIKLEWIHLFESRRKNFGNENILQENVIIKGIKNQKYSSKETIVISSSMNYRDLHENKIKRFKIENIIDLKSQHKILHIPVNDKQEKIIKIFRKWTGNLTKYHLQISTGPVVTFRAKDYIFSEANDQTFVPLYDLHNIGQMKFVHPISKNGKGQYIRACEKTKKLLLRNKNYVFLRRFSTKEDNKRLIAAPYFMDITKSEFIGVENHLNYIYKPNGNMSRSEVLGISTLLNSKLFDDYFRLFNGNINVSATELRTITLPPLELIKKIGVKLILENNFHQADIESIIENILFEKNRLN